MKYIILLRGINVGGRNIKMADLKTCFEANGYKNVQTILQTGNVIVETGKMEEALLQKKIEQMLSARFGYDAKVLIVLPAQLQALVNAFPFTDKGADFHRYIYFTEKGNVTAILATYDLPNNPLDAVAKGDDVIYWSVQKGNTLDSPFGKYMSKAASKYLVTSRNVNTLQKILLKCE